MLAQRSQCNWFLSKRTVFTEAHRVECRFARRALPMERRRNANTYMRTFWHWEKLLQKIQKSARMDGKLCVHKVISVGIALEAICAARVRRPPSARALGTDSAERSQPTHISTASAPLVCGRLRRRRRHKVHTQHTRKSLTAKQQPMRASVYVQITREFELIQWQCMPFRQTIRSDDERIGDKMERENTRDERQKKKMPSPHTIERWMDSGTTIN